MIRETFTDNWKMKEVDGEKEYNVSVPSSVLSILLDNGDIEDPFYRDNELKCMPLFEKDYEFTRVFSASGDIIREDEVDLVFYGIDTLADVYLNNKRLSFTSNMHCTYRFSVKDRLIPGANEIKIVLHSPLRYINEYVAEENKKISYVPTGCISGNQYVRKAHSMFGWDWGPKLPDMGIFRKVELEAYSKVAIKEVYFDQIHEDGKVSLLVDPILKITDSIPVEIFIKINGKYATSSVIRMPEEGEKETPKGRNESVIEIENPKLWWPNGQGEPHLYDVNITIKKSDTVYDERDYKIGLRTMSVSRKKDEFGEEFAFVVNGRKIFAMGADYIPEDCIYSRINRDKIEKLVKSAAKANYNMLRVWGGGYYPSDDFYDLCDQYGIIVWQDLMFACNIYDLTPEFEKNIVAETHDNVKRIRHHACLGLWCGNNELESGWDHWAEFQKETPYLRADYIKMFEHVLPNALREVDDSTFYWPSSPSSGGCFDAPDDENRGDAHYWEVWHGQKPFKEYKNHYFRFLSEFGFQSFPCKKTVDSFALPEDQNIFSYVMEKHQKNASANGNIMHYISENFLYPKDFESLLYVSQILQGMAIKYCVDHLRRNRGRCMGALYWQINDNWPVASWSSIDYYGRWKALHYMAKKFYEPLCGSIERIYDKDGNETNSFAASVVNDTEEPVSYKVRLSVMEIAGKEICHFDETGRVLPGKVSRLKTHDFTRYVEKKGEQNVFLKAEYAFSNGEHRYEYETFVPYKHLNLIQPMVTFDVKELEDCYEIEIESDCFTPFVMIDLRDRDAVFEDNVFTVSAGEPYVIYLKKSEMSGEPFKDADELCDHIDIWFLQRSFMRFAGDPQDEFDVSKSEDQEVYDELYDGEFLAEDIVVETEEELKERLKKEIEAELRQKIKEELLGENGAEDKTEEVTESEDNSSVEEIKEPEEESKDSTESIIGEDDTVEELEDIVEPEESEEANESEVVTESADTGEISETNEITDTEEVVELEEVVEVKEPEEQAPKRRGYFHQPVDGIRIRDDSDFSYSSKLFHSIEHLQHGIDAINEAVSDDEEYEVKEEFYEAPEFTKEMMAEEYAREYEEEIKASSKEKKPKKEKKEKRRLRPKLDGIRIR